MEAARKTFEQYLGSAKVDSTPHFFPPAHYFIKDGKPILPKVDEIVNLDSRWLWICVGSVLFNPIFWNCVARNEYRNKTLTKVFGGPYAGTYFLAVVIFSLGIIRDIIFKNAMADQPLAELLSFPAVQYAAIALFALGQLFVLTSIYQLGITGTYLGDYFGILMSSRVTGFPFNVMENPMYNGSTMCFVATALWYKKPAGLIVSVLVFVVYQVALLFEGPFTNKIYSNAATKAAIKSVKKSTPAATPAPKTPSAGKSYASAVAATPSKAGLRSTDPKAVPQPIATHSVEDAGKDTLLVDKVDSRAGSPMRMTRSRSKARIVDSD